MPAEVEISNRTGGSLLWNFGMLRKFLHNRGVFHRLAPTPSVAGPRGQSELSTVPPPLQPRVRQESPGQWRGGLRSLSVGPVRRHSAASLLCPRGGNLAAARPTKQLQCEFHCDNNPIFSQKNVNSLY